MELSSMYKKILVVFLFLLITFTTSCTPNEATSDSRQVLINYLDVMNTGNLDELNKMVIEEKKVANKYVETVKSIKYNSIKIINDEDMENSYSRNLSAEKYDINNLEIYQVDFDIVYKDGLVLPEPSGNYIWYFVLVRDLDTDKWLLANWGV